MDILAIYLLAILLIAFQFYLVIGCIRLMTIIFSAKGDYFADSKLPISRLVFIFADVILNHYSVWTAAGMLERTRQLADQAEK